MASSVQDFKKASRKAVKLPGGLEVEIRKLTGFDFVDLGEFPMPPAKEGGEEQGDAETIKRIRDYSERMIARAVVSPPFSDRAEDLNNDAVVHVRELSVGDFNALGLEIARFSGLTKEDQAEAASFRPDQEQKDR